MNIDMHFHSQNSDGRNSVSELIQTWKKRWLDIMALTDHDRITTDEFITLAKKNWIKTCRSVEISALDKEHNKSMHLTMYAKEIRWKILEAIDNVIAKKQELIVKQLELFKEKWFYVDSAEFFSWIYNTWRKRDSINKFDIARYVFNFEQNRILAENYSQQNQINVEEFYKRF